MKGQDKKIHLFDTFSGMPYVNEAIDLHRVGDFKDTSLEAVKNLFSDISYAKFYPGRFPETSLPVQNNRFAFVYIDADIYQSVLDALMFFYPRMPKGGIMVFDDFMGKNTPGVKKALDEFLKGKLELPIITTVGQCLFIKQ